MSDLAALQKNLLFTDEDVQALRRRKTIRAGQTDAIPAFGTLTSRRANSNGTANDRDRLLDARTAGRAMVSQHCQIGARVT
ncbi:hypothetical protein [Cupriavidus sp. BIC8F]|uniref:hypothetical protein n=1 Tax=Cupriavidus sp. BIC8F TaxID=3079014 RepID=UPI002915E8BE|nr:hypothetical protein [Cupriavidus sp. BIC8F]